MEWQPIETVPFNEEVLVWNGEDMIVVVRHEDTIWNMHFWQAVGVYGPDTDLSINDKKPTNWMPLPQPPADSEG